MFLNQAAFAPRSRPAIRQSLAGVLLGMALSASVHAQTPSPSALALQDALRMAQDRSQQLVAQDALATASREMAVAAGQRPDPVLRAGISNLPVNGEDRFSLTRDFMTMRSVGVMQEFTRSDKLSARSARYEKEAEVADAGRSLALTKLQAGAAAAWLDRYFQERAREVLSQQRNEARLQVEAADAAYRGGKGNQADVFTARSAVAQIEDRIVQADRQIATATTALARWVGAPATSPLGPLPKIDQIPLTPRDLESRLAHHPQIQLMLKQEETAQAEAEMARANKKSDWTVEVMYSQRGSAYSNMLSVNLSVPLQWDQKNRQDRELSAKLAMVERMRAEREEATRSHVSEAMAMLQEWQSDRDRLGRYDNSLIPLAAERTRAAIAAYRGGAAPLYGVLEARRNEIEVRLERIRLEMDAGRLWAQLNYLIPEGHVATATQP
ncbi:MULTISPECIES: TolC family protein [unclassified Variovorax]|uniref:TolC family protein n=1 Tax=unclassified Variovorax TaxID=663243 RepID=UPI000F7E163C|nr:MULTISPECIES: TolC family protein [unclassified Variovorax]RSZ29540.1 TolC family protein [Variovorax sp. 553]RSZ30135.1 TolC family protein [Variovorax sp. 679]